MNHGRDRTQPSSARGNAQALRAPWLTTAVAVVALVSVNGCAAEKYLHMRKVPFNPLESTLKLVSRQGPQPSERTMQLLRQYDLVEAHKKNAQPVLVQLQQALVAEPSPEKCYAVAELAYIGGLRAKERGNQQQALDFFAAAVSHAYLYLFDPRFENVRNHYDPMFRQSCNIYNASLESALRICHEQNGLLPGRVQKVRVGDRTIDVKIVLRGAWRNEDVERLEFVSDYQLEGLNNRHHTYGLGVPLIAVRRRESASDHAEKYYPEGLSFAVTAFFRLQPQTGGQTTCELELHDPLVSRFTQVGPWPVPLETDLTTPLAYFLDMPETTETSQLATLALLNPNRVPPGSGLFMVEPYNPQKIPVLMVHGLWSSPLTWMEMFNDLRNYPEIRERYQFWFYLYPTGQPFWLSAGPAPARPWGNAGDIGSGPWIASPELHGARGTQHGRARLALTNGR